MYCACVFWVMHHFVYMICMFMDICFLDSSGKKVIRALYGVHIKITACLILM